MGLDLVDIVCQTEKEFEIIIPDEVATTLTTPRKVIDYLMSLPKVNQKWSTDYVSISFWLIVENEGGINREKFNDDSHFIEDMKLS